MGLVFAFVLLSAVLLEGSLTTLPLVLLVLVVTTIMYRQSYVFGIAFVCGLLLDLLTLRPVGETCVVFVMLVLFVRLYERKFETSTLPFVLFATALGTLVYSLIFALPQVLLEIIFNMVGAACLFAVVALLQRKRIKKQYRAV